MTMYRERIRKLGRALLAGAAAAALTTGTAQAQTGRAAQVDIPAQTMSAALNRVGRQTGTEIIFSPSSVRGLRAPAVQGNLTVEQALERLLAGSGLTYRRTGQGAIVVESRSGEAQAGGAAANSGSADQGAVSEILVVGSRSNNADIRRTEDDSQPYVIFDRSQVENAQSDTVEDFLKTRLPMNSAFVTGNQTGSSANASAINLRGLGANQTLILVDGRRVPSRPANFGGVQPDINGLPPSMIERIEVLPSTSSGIYGGGATGGVVNIITRRDYTGLDLSLTYGDTFRGDLSNYRLNVAGGLSLEGGRTRIVASASRSETSALLPFERNFSNRARARQFANNPASIYTTTGNPILGATPNIRSANNSNLVLDAAYGGTALNSPRTFVPTGFAGVNPAVPGSAAPLVANAGFYNLDIPRGSSSAAGNGLQAATANSASFNVRREFGRSIEAYVDFIWMENVGQSLSQRAPTTVRLGANAPNNPFTTDILVSFPDTSLPAGVDRFETDTLRALGGVIARLGRGWTISAEYSWGRTQSLSAFYSVFPVRTGGTVPNATTALQTGTLDVIRDLYAYPLDYSPYRQTSPFIAGPVDSVLQNATVRSSGALFDIWGGPITLTAVGEWRNEDASGFYTGGTFNTGLTSYDYSLPVSQRVWAAYLETRIPIVSARNAGPLRRALELQLSVRYEDYRTIQSTPITVSGLPSLDAPLPASSQVANNVEATSYTLGLRYVPVDGITLRASYGTGFLPPSVTQLVPNPLNPNFSATLVDPRRGNVASLVGPINLIGGGNPSLIPEDSRSWSAGVIIEPRAIPGLRLSADYTDIRKTNEIGASGAQVILNNEEFLPGRVVRDPLTAADIAAGYTGGVIREINTSAYNLGRRRVHAWDFQGDYAHDFGRAGRLQAFVVATYQPVNRQRLRPDSAIVDLTGFQNGTLEWRGNAGLTWDLDDWTFGWAAQYFGPYSPCTATALPAACATSVLNQGSARIPSQVYHDLFVRHRFGERPGSALSGLELLLGVQNVFDRSPPIVVSSGSGYSFFGDPRLQRFTFTARKHF